MATSEELRAARIREALAEAGVDLADPADRAALVQNLTGSAAPDRKLTPAEKQRRCLELRAAGASFDQIADLVGYASRGAAYKATMTALAKVSHESAEESRALWLERLDAMLAGGLYTKALRGDVYSIDRVLKIMGEHRRLVAGLEVPVPRGDDAAGIFGGGGPITVELVIPEPDDLDPVPESELENTVSPLALNPGPPAIPTDDA